jgi:hypothetical protein
MMLWLSFAFWTQTTAGASSISEVASNGLVLPTAVAPYSKEQYVVADAALQRIFIVANDGSTRVIAGGGKPNALGSVGGAFADGLGRRARFNAPQGIATDAAGNIYVADTGSSQARAVAPQCPSRDAPSARDAGRVRGGSREVARGGVRHQRGHRTIGGAIGEHPRRPRDRRHPELEGYSE